MTACTSCTLTAVKVSAGPCYCWLHFEVSPPEDFANVIRHVANWPSTHISISGKKAVEIHDRVDDILAQIDRKLDVATIWHEGSLEDAAWDFLNLDFVDNNAPTRIVAAFSNSLDRELELLAEVIRTCRKEIE